MKRTRDTQNLRDTLDTIKEKAASRIKEFQDLNSYLFQAMDIVSKNLVLVKNELDLALNRLRHKDAHQLGGLVLADEELPTFLDNIEQKLTESQSKEVKKGFSKLLRKLDGIERKFKFSKSQILFEKVLILVNQSYNGEKSTKFQQESKEKKYYF